jgi:hypothetical protein
MQYFHNKIIIIKQSNIVYDSYYFLVQTIIDTF